MPTLCWEDPEARGGRGLTQREELGRVITAPPLNMKTWGKSADLRLGKTPQKKELKEQLFLSLLWAQKSSLKKTERGFTILVDAFSSSCSCFCEKAEERSSKKLLRELFAGFWPTLLLLLLFSSSAASETLWRATDCNPSGFSAHGTSQARIPGCRFLPQGNLPNPGIKPSLLRCTQTLYRGATREVSA